MGIDDRHSFGQSVYENLVFTGQEWIGLNIEQMFPNPLATGASTVTNCHFTSIGFQGFHLHTAQNVTATGLYATGCGVAEGWGNDGAGIGGHSFCTNVTIGESESSGNIGAGFFFEEGNINLTLRDNTARGNGNGGMRVYGGENVVITGGVIAGNAANDTSKSGGGIEIGDVTRPGISPEPDVIENQTQRR